MDKNHTQSLSWELLNNIIEKAEVHWPIIEINVNQLIPIVKETINKDNKEKHE